MQLRSADCTERDRQASRGGELRPVLADTAVSCVCAVLATTHTERLQKIQVIQSEFEKKNFKTLDSVGKNTFNYLSVSSVEKLSLVDQNCDMI